MTALDRPPSFFVLMLLVGYCYDIRRKFTQEVQHPSML